MFYMRFKKKIIEKMSESLRSLTKNERLWAIHSEEMSNRAWIAQVAHFWAKNERLARKSDERIPIPDF